MEPAVVSTDVSKRHSSAAPAKKAEVSLPVLCENSFNLFRSSRLCAWREAGHWRWLSTEDLRGEIRRLALALRHAGVMPGDRVALLGEPSPHWLISDLAIMAIGGVSVPLFPAMSPEHFHHAIEHTATRTMIVLGAAGWALAHTQLARFRHVIVRGVPGSVQAGARVHTWHESLSRGDDLSADQPALYAQLLAQVTPDDVATIIHTSGSTGLPKGVTLTHRNLVSQVQGACSVFPLVAGRDRCLSCLPFAHVFERVVVYTYLVQGAPVYVADDVKLVGVLLRDVQPAAMSAVPRLIEKLHARIRAQISNSVAIKRQLGTWAVDLATREGPALRPAQPGDQHGALARGSHPLALRIADRLIYGKLRQALGGHLKYLIVGGAALSEDLQRFLTGVGLPVYTGYGLTEASPVIAVNRPGARRIGTVGQAFPGVEIRIATSVLGETGGEILARGPNIMLGYHGDAAATAKVIDADGWLHTGDVGTLDEAGFLSITGRMKELFKTANGKYVAPTPIEQALVARGQEHGGLVDQALVIAEGQPCVGALLFPEAETLQRKKRELSLEQLTDAEFLARPEIAGEFAHLIAEVNSGLNHWEQVRCWRFIAESPSVANEGLTPTLKLRRHVLAQRYQPLIADMYAQRSLAGAGGEDHV